jgi:predicted nucleotidyltransferase
MAEIPKEIIDKLNRFFAEVEKSNIHIEQAILFGSYAKGTQNKYSDIDLAIVSKNFDGVQFFDLDKLRDARFAVDTDISAIPYLPQDFTPDNLFVKEILRDGIRVI